MDNLGSWLSATKDHVVNHWQEHVVPLVIMFAASMVVGLGATALFMVAGMFVSLVAAITQSGVMSMLAALLLFGLCMLLLVVLSLALVPVYMGHVRVALRAHRGEPPDSADLTWGFRNLGKVAVFTVLSFTISMVAMMLCYFPALLVGVALMFAVPAMVDRDLGAVEAMKLSWELARPRFFELLVLWFLYVAVSMIASYIPLVGPFIAVIAYVGAMVVIYDDLVQRDHFPA